MTGLAALALIGACAVALGAGILFGAGMTFLILRTERADRRDACLGAANGGSEAGS